MNPTAAEHPGYWTQMSKADAVHAANGWGSHFSQQARFSAYLRHARRLLDPGDSLLDYGCGTGELVDRLPNGIRYTGIDRNDGMRDRARREHPDYPFVSEREYETDEGQGLVGIDHVVCLGTFNLAPYTLDDVAGFMIRAGAVARKSFALSVRVRAGGFAEDLDGHLTLDVDDIVHICPFGRYVLDRSYSDHDALLVAYPEP